MVGGGVVAYMIHYLTSMAVAWKLDTRWLHHLPFLVWKYFCEEREEEKKGGEGGG